MRQDYQQLLKPEILKTVSGLALISRIITNGYLPGLNISKNIGSGMEFSQFRSYEPGDDLRLLDWKILARSDRYYIKQAEIETNIAVKFILDTSNSMLHSEDGLSKMDYAKVLIASLAYIAQNQGDAVGLFALNNQHLHSIYPKVQKQHYNRLLQELLLIENRGKWPKDSNTLKQLHDRNQKELLFFITDFYEDNEELSSFIQGLKTSRNEVVVLHLMGKTELKFNYKGTSTFEDLETGVKIKVNAKTAKKQYLKSLETMLKNIKDILLAHNISYHLFTLGEPMAETLRLFLKQRKRLL